MHLLVYTDPVMESHVNAAGHPERPERLGAVLAGAAESSAKVDVRQPPQAEESQLARVHDVRYIRHIQDFCAAGGGRLDADTGAVTESWDAALRAAGAGAAAVSALEVGEGDLALLAVRPPGHHAVAAGAMGFCLFNNIAVTAAELAERGDRVAIVDWDVHHGNGTQEMFYEDDRVLYVSLHEFPFYPGTGWFEEDGSGAGVGHTVNVPLPAATRGDAYVAAFERVVEPIIERFAPDWLLISAGYDAHRSDPLADLLLATPDYGWMASRLRPLVAERRTIVYLEGGYDLDALRTATAATVDGFAGIEQALPEGASPDRAYQFIELARARLSGPWTLA